MGFRKQIITDTIVKGLKPGDTVMDTKVEGFGVRRQTRRAHYLCGSTTTAASATNPSGHTAQAK